MKKFLMLTVIVVGVCLFVIGMGSLGVANKAKSDACHDRGGLMVQSKCVAPK